MQNVITFCALVCALVVSGCAADINGNPCLPALSGCGVGADAGDTSDDGGTIDASDVTSDSDTTNSDVGNDSADGHGTDTMTTGSLTVLCNVDGAKIVIDGVATGKVTPATVDIPTGVHTVLVEYEGRLLWNKGDTEFNTPLSVEVNRDQNTDADLVLYYDSTGWWEEVESTSTHKWKMKIDGPSDECPDGGPYILSIAGRLCLDSPTKISICKDKNPNCDVHGTGEVLEDGMKIVLNEYIFASGKTFKTTYKNKGL